MPRVDGEDKVTGRAVYTADITLPNMVHGKILGSPHAHAIVKKVDASKARALPGVLYLGPDVPVASWVHVIEQNKARVVIMSIVQAVDRAPGLEVAEALRDIDGGLLLVPLMCLRTRR